MGVRTANKNKVAYKVFKVTKGRGGYYLISPYQRTVWKNKEMEAKLGFVYLLYQRYQTITEGIHAFVNKKAAYQEQGAWTRSLVVEMVIPKGENYVLGMDKDIAATKMRIKRTPTQSQLRKIYEN